MKKMICNYEKYADTELSSPMYNVMKEEEQDQAISCLNTF